MKKLPLFSAAALVATLSIGHADEVALLTIQIDKDPTPKSTTGGDQPGTPPAQ